MHAWFLGVTRQYFDTLCSTKLKLSVKKQIDERLKQIQTVHELQKTAEPLNCKINKDYKA